MSTPTEQLKHLLTTGTSKQDFKHLAMTLTRQGADITVRSRSGSEPTLLHILIHQNNNGANDNEIIEVIGLNRAVLASTDYYSRTALQSLLDDIAQNKCTFVNFKQSAMLLARQGADITRKSKVGQEYTLLHELVRYNENGANDKEITELIQKNPAILGGTNYSRRTTLEALLDGFVNKKCPLTPFKQSAMLLIRLGADITCKSKEGDEPTLLHILVLHNENGVNNTEIEELVKQNPAILEGTNYYGCTPLQSLLNTFLIKKCSITYFKHSAMFLARQGADITCKSKEGDEPTLLHVLALQNENGSNINEIIELIELNQAVLVKTDYYDRTALQSLLDDLLKNRCTDLAKNQRNFAKFKQSAMLLVRHGADITLKSKCGDESTLLHVLTFENENGANNKDMAELVKLNANVLTSTDYYGRTALQSLIDAFTNNPCTLDNFKQSAMALVRLGASLSQQGTTGNNNTLLHALVLNNIDENNNEISVLITLFSDVLNYKDYYGRTPLHSLLSTRPNVTINTIERLLSETNLHVKDNHGETLLHAACLHGNLPAVKYFFDKSLSLTALTASKKTLIHCAVHSGNLTLLQWLIDTTQIDINAKDTYGKTALFEAAYIKNREVFEFLARNGADISPYQTAAELYVKIQHSCGEVLRIQAELSNSVAPDDQRTPQENPAPPSSLNKLFQNIQTANELLQEIRTARDDIARDQDKLKDEVTPDDQRSPEILTTNEPSDISPSLSKGVLPGNQGQVVQDDKTTPGIAMSRQNLDPVPYHCKSRKILLTNILAMQNYGVFLSDQGISKGQVVIELAWELMIMANQFFKQKPEQRHFAEFQPRFTALLHSKDQEMNAYRMDWGTLIANIAIALTGIGLLFIAGKLIHSKVTENRALFFFQKSKTTSEEKIADIEHAANQMATDRCLTQA